MNVLLFLVPMSLVLLLVAVWAFRWAVGKGQFENLDAAAIDILRDDSTDQGPDAPPQDDATSPGTEAAPAGNQRGGGPRAD